MKYAVLYHNYYDLAGVDDVRKRIRDLKDEDSPNSEGSPGNGNISLLCSLPDKFAGDMVLQNENEKFIIAGNIGKDIGGKLILIDLLLNICEDTEYAIFLHDKRSYQKHSGPFEKENLFSILGKDKFYRIGHAFEMDPRLGIACAAGCLKNEYLGEGHFDSTNSALLIEAIEKYNLKIKDYRFVAGTMFWIRTSLLKDFFTRFSPLGIRGTLEEGNVLDDRHGTSTHSWERLLSWISTAAGFKIKEF